MNGTTHNTAGNTANNGYADLLGLGTDGPTEVEMHDMQVDPTLARQAHPNDASFHNGQARSTLDLSNTTQRPIRAHHNRRHKFRNSNRHPQNDYYPHRQSVYRHLDDDRGRAYPYDRQTRQPSPDALRNRGEAIFVPDMADLDVKEERDDRRDGDRYRGGGHNKRRRDGKLATRQLSSFRDTNMDRR
jgi:hypothetical protein